jgi:iron complex transport system permease protein
MTKRHNIIFICLAFFLCLLAVLHFGNWKMDYDFNSLNNALFFNGQDEQSVILREIRFPRTTIAIFAGAGLALAGLLLQTFLQNPLAGPSILGISSGSSLVVALLMMTGVSFFNQQIGITTGAFIGAMLFCGLIVLFSLFVKSHVSLLIIGMMISALANSLIQVIEILSNSSQLKLYTLWNFGSLQQVNFNELWIVILFFTVCVFFLFLLVKPMNALVLGEFQAANLGVNVKMIRIAVIVLSSVFAGLITAFCGPISFIGLAVPNVTKRLFKTQDHFRLFSACILLGAITLLLCDSLIILLQDYITLPLNAITSLIGAPIVIWIILKKY